MANSCVRGAMAQARVRLRRMRRCARRRRSSACRAERQHQRELRSVDEEAGGKLPVSRLQKGGGRIGVRRAGCREEREDGADRDIGIDVRRAVERVDGERQPGAGIEQHRHRQFLGSVPGDRRVAHRVEEDLVGIDVEVLLQVAVGIGAAARFADGRAERAGIDGPADLERRTRKSAHDLDGRAAQPASGPLVGRKECIQSRCGHVFLSSTSVRSPGIAARNCRAAKHRRVPEVKFNHFTPG